ncbi:MAG TPA: hypothetical protein VMS56_01355 [Thermoanaerobaculia bacterium]|nr:hypothetical protein [Thermoanaerobaculia bacterium]
MLRARDEEIGRTPELVIATLTDAREADTARAALGSAGIAARVTTIATPKLGAGGERVDVRFGVSVAPHDARHAIEILHARLTSTDGDAIELDLDEPLEPPRHVRCPECESEQVRTTSTVIGALLGAAVLAAVGWAIGQEDVFYLAAVIVALILVLGPNRRCLQCGHRWME